MTNALVRTLNKVHAQAPLQLVLLGGNLIDNAQQNESSWCSTLQLRAAAPRACCGAADVEACVRPMLDEARADKKWVILAAHQRAVGLARRGPLVD